MLPGARYTRAIMIVVMVVVILGLVAATVATPS